MTTYFKEDPYLFTEDSIDGVPFYYKHIDTSPCVYIKLVFNYGAMYDEVGFEGTAHFLEHMILKGCDLIEDEKAYREFVRTYTLGTSNAMTSLYNMQIVGKCLPEDLEHVLNTYFSMITTPKFSPEPVEEEKKVIIQEIWRSYTNQTYSDYLQFTRKNCLQDFPEIIRLGRPFGWVDSVNKITPEILRKAQQTFLVKNNLRIFIAGNLNQLEHIKDIFKTNLSNMKLGDIAKKPNVPKTISDPKEIKLENKYVDIGLGDEEQASIEAEIILPKLDPKTELSKIAILRLITILVNELALDKLRVENKLCYTANAGISTTVTLHNFYIHSKLNPEYIDKSIALIKEIINGLSLGLYEDKFNANKILIIKRLVSAERTTSDIIEGAAGDYINYNHNFLLGDLLTAMEEVTYQNTIDFAKEYLPLDKFVFEILKPKNI